MRFLILILLSSFLYSQDFELYTKQRRLADQIAVELWVKATTADEIKIDSCNIPLLYNSEFLEPNPTYQLFVPTYDFFGLRYTSLYPPLEQPGPEHRINLSSKEKNSNKYVELNIKINPFYGSFGPIENYDIYIGSVIFNIINHDNLTLFDSTDIAILDSELSFHYDQIEKNFTYEEPESKSIIGIDIINPEGIFSFNHNFLEVSAYPIYIERSGLIIPTSEDRYSNTNKIAYSIEISTSEDTWTELLRVGEHRVSLDELIFEGKSEDYYYSKDIITNNGLNSGRLFTTAGGDVLPLPIFDGYNGTLRILSKLNNFNITDNFKMRACLLDQNNNIPIDQREVIQCFDIQTILEPTTSIFDSNINAYFSNNNLYVNTEVPFEVNVYNILGNVVYKTDYNSSSIIELNHLKVGTYIYSIIFNNNTVTTGKFIKL